MLPEHNPCDLSIGNRQFPLIFVLMGVVLLLRIAFLHGMGLDQGFQYSAMANALSGGIVFHEAYSLYFHEVVLVPTALMYSLFGAGDFSSLFFPVLLSTFSIYFVWAITSRFAGTRAAMITSAVYAVNPLISIYGTSLHPAVFLEFMTLLTGVLFLRAVHGEKWSGYAWAGMSASILSLCHVSGALFFVLLLLYQIHCHIKKTAGNPGAGQNRIYPAAASFAFFLLVSAGMFILVHVVFAVLCHTPFSYLDLLRNPLKSHVVSNATGHRDVLFFVFALFKKQGAYNSDFFAGCGYLVFPAAVYCLVRKIKSSHVFIAWFLGHLALLTISVAVTSGPVMHLHYSYLIVLVLPMTAICVIALMDLSRSSGRYGKTIAWFLFFLIPLASFTNGWVLRADLKNSAVQKEGWTSLIASHSGETPGTGPAVVYASDAAFPLWYGYYNGFQNHPPVRIENLDDIETTGILLVQKGIPEEKYCLDTDERKNLRQGVPRAWHILAQTDEATLFKVAPLSPLAYSLVKNRMVMSEKWHLDLLPGDIKRHQGVTFVNQKMNMFGRTWRNDNHLFVGAKKSGGEFAIEITSMTETRKALIIGLTKASDFGMMDVYLNGERVLHNLDLYHHTVIFQEIQIEALTFVQGRNDLSFHLTGKNPKSRGYRAGVDYIDVR